MVALDWGLSSTRDRLRKAPTFSISRADRKFLVGVLIALIGVRLLLIFWLPVTDTTEARYVEIARKMLESGDWITPQFDVGVPFWGKPPLHTWLSAIGMKLFGVGHFGARIFIFLTSIATAILCLNWVRQTRGRDQALIAIAVMASSVMFFGASAFVMTDMVMVLGTTLSMIAFYRSMHEQQNWKHWGNLFFVGLAIGLMAKGPVAAVLTIIPLFLWLLIGNRWYMLRRLPWRSGLLLLAALTLPWYIAAEIKTPGFLRYFIVGEHFERFVVPGWSGDLYGTGHVEPKGMIWLFAAGVFLPWSFFALVLAVKTFRILELVRDDDHGWYSYLAFWALSPLILFSPAANILPAYALPAVPAAAILLTSLWADVWGRPGAATRIAGGTALSGMVCLFLAIAIVAHVAPARLTPKTELMLVDYLQRIDPDTALTYWGDRSYSGEFYTGGAAQNTSAPEDLQSLLINHRRDAIAVAPQSLNEVTGIVGPQFRDLGLFGRRHLLVENTIDGAKP